MPSFSQRSLGNLGTAHPVLQMVFHEVVRYWDCIVIQGHRSHEDQEAAFWSGTSQLRGGQSRHNRNPAEAVDVAPYFAEEPHIRWEDWKAWYAFGGFVLGVATRMGVVLRWGGDWDSDRTFHDQSFHDLPHFELVDFDPGLMA